MMIATESETKVYEDIRIILASARKNTISAINAVMVMAYWEVGFQISESVGDRAEYGKGLLLFLSERLTKEFGKGFTVANLRNMRQFYQTFPIRYALRTELTWTHYRLLMRVEEPSRREFYLNECVESGWTSRQLERQINSFYYERLLATHKEHRTEIQSEIHRTEPKTDPDHILKDPYVFEFLGLKENAKYSESDMEQGLIDSLQDFLLELGKGFSFVARQKQTA
jgi:predicted nuclease of restriction endonuclease-like (RecB) superfamily